MRPIISIWENPRIFILLLSAREFHFSFNRLLFLFWDSENDNFSDRAWEKIHWVVFKYSFAFIGRLMIWNFPRIFFINFWKLFRIRVIGFSKFIPKICSPKHFLRSLNFPRKFRIEICPQSTSIIAINNLKIKWDPLI
jgi:hypothetical protein